MATQLEQHLYLRRYQFRQMLNSLSKSWPARRFTREEQAIFLDTLNCLLQEIDAITGLAFAAKQAIRDGEEVRRVLLGSGGNGHGGGNDHSQQSQLIQFTLPEYAITEQLMKVQKSRSGTIARLTIKMEHFNSLLRELVVYREQSKRARRMDMIGYPTFSVANMELDIRLVDDFYEEILNPYPWYEVIDMQRPTGDQA